MGSRLATVRCECPTTPIYNEKHDAHFCASCDTWLDPTCCGEEPCDAGYCDDRPEKPSQVRT
jgi:hypothetical protein